MADSKAKKKQKKQAIKEEKTRKAVALTVPEKKGKDILLVVDSVSNEKGVARELIFKAIELALASITAKRYLPDEADIRVAIDRDSGEYESFRQWLVTEIPSEPGKEIALVEAKKLDSDLEIGDVVEEHVESVDFGRIAAQQAKQIILREIRNAEREEVANQYKEKIDSLIIGIVKKVTREYILLDMRNTIEAILPREDLLPHDAFQVGDRVRGVLKEVTLDRKGLQLIVSRTVPKMLVQLFKLEVPEINEDVIEIKAVARDPGLRAKMAVKTNDGRIDPIGACIGIKGSRVQAVSNELNGERIDVIMWNDDPAQLVVNAMAPAELSSIAVDEESHSMDIAVKDEQLAQAIGRNGQNIQLASKLTGWTLNVMTEDDLKQKSKNSTKELLSAFTKDLDVDEDLAVTLVQEGFNTLESIAYVPVDELLTIPGFDKEMAEELQNRAKNALLKKILTSKKGVGKVEPAKDLLELDGMTRQLAYVLASHGIVTREDLAEKSVDELAEIEEIDEKLAAKLIMKARAHWFE